jgi:hypothetical protein
MESERDHADDQVGPGNPLPQGGRVLDVQGNGRPARVAGDDPRRPVRLDIADLDQEARLVEEVPATKIFFMTPSLSGSVRRDIPTDIDNPG